MEMVLGLMSGIGLFLYGMKVMSDGIEKAAGDKLRHILNIFTTNRIFGVLVGMFVTVIIQSSSACTVMAVSFVNANLMNLSQALGVILGANIGTTITAQLIAFKLTTLAPVFLLVGVIMVLFISNDKVRKYGLVVLGFGVLFVGLNLMSSAIEPLKTDPRIPQLLTFFSNPFMALLTGALLTTVIQSSSASIGILQVLAMQIDIPLAQCIYIVLGCNIGACMPVLLSALGTNHNTKRAAAIYLFFNVFGSAFIFILMQFLPICDWIESLTALISKSNRSLEIANAHTLYNIVSVLFILPFSSYLIKFLEWIIPEKNKEEKSELSLQFLSDSVLITPAAAVQQAINEVRRMGRLTDENLKRGMKAFLDEDRELVELVKEKEEVINFLNHEITSYLVRINQLEITREDAERIGSLFHIVNDIERIGDHAINLTDAAMGRIEEKLVFSKESEDELQDLLNQAGLLFEESIDLLESQDISIASEIRRQEETIDELERKYQQHHIDRLTANLCTPYAGMVFSDILSNLERVADHSTNIAFLSIEGNAHTHLQAPTDD